MEPPRRGIKSPLPTTVTAIVFKMLLLIHLMTLTFPVAHAFNIGGGESLCAYEFQLNNNTMRIVCPNTPGVVNLFADTARLQTDTVHHQARGSTGRGSGKSHYRRREYSDEELNGNDPYSLYVSNVSDRLDATRREMNGYMHSVQNLSLRLSEGDSNLRNDMETFMRTSDSFHSLKQGIAATLRNQFNFMRSALLSRSQELQRLVSSMGFLVEITQEGMNSARATHRIMQDKVIELSDTLGSVRGMLTSELRKRGKRRHRGKKGKKASVKDKCPKIISAIGTGNWHPMNAAVGSYMVQSNNPDEYRSVYVMLGSGPRDEILEYDTPLDISFDIPAHYIPLPYHCSGTGHAVFRRHLYCHRHGTDLVMKYHLKRYDIQGEIQLVGAGHSNTFPYSSGHNTDVDLAVDEMGLWAIYATNTSAGKVVISQLDHKRMELGKTWMTSFPKRSLGNAFMICGTLYATASHSAAPTYIRYVFNTNTGREQVLREGELTFPNSGTIGRLKVFEPVGKPSNAITSLNNTRADVGPSGSNTVMLSYDFRTSRLMTWNNGYLETFPIYFREED